MGNTMMKRQKWIKRCGAWLCSFCCLCIGGAAVSLSANTAVTAEESQGYVWGETKCISIAPPFTYSSFGTVSFQVCFDKDITTTNYKHLAAGANALKTFSKNDTPNMTTAIIDSLDASGVFDSMNDCIAFNGKKIRELQKYSPIACMVQVGELGVNNSMNIDLNGTIPEVKIYDMNQPFTFTFYEGLKFPSGVELKETVTWAYNPQTRTFSQVETSESNETGFSVYYNGQKLTKENNLVTIYDKDTFDMDNLLVLADSVSATVEIEPKFETLSDGLNYLLITCRAENSIDFDHMQVVFDLQQTEEEKSLGCGSVVSSVSGLTLVLACGMYVCKRGKQA